jgi:hypothetical protein
MEKSFAYERRQLRIVDQSLRSLLGDQVYKFGIYQR